MPDKKPDRPWIELSVSEDGLKAKWGNPSGTPLGSYGIFNAKMVHSPENVKVHEWWLIVGTKSKHNQPDKDDEPIRGETFYFDGTVNETIIPIYRVPAGQKIIAQVIGFFNSKNELLEPIVEGIYSDVARLKMPEPKV